MTYADAIAKRLLDNGFFAGLCEQIPADRVKPLKLQNTSLQSHITALPLLYRDCRQYTIHSGSISFLYTIYCVSIQWVQSITSLYQGERFFIERAGDRPRANTATITTTCPRSF